MPELPEAERARQTLEAVLDREIVSVDDRDTYICRPHPPGEIAAALIGHRLVAANRRGKFLWLDTVDGPTLGLHLSMTGAIVLNPPETLRSDRFAIDFANGGRFVLRDRRRLGRAVLNPDYAHVGPDAALVDRDAFRRRIGSGRTAVKARLLHQGAISGVGNLLADEALWRARISPLRPHRVCPRPSSTGCVASCAPPSDRRSGAAAPVQAGSFKRGPAGVRPLDGHPLSRARAGGRTTYWCEECQK